MQNYTKNLPIELELPNLIIFYACDLIYLLDAIRRLLNLKSKTKSLPFRKKLPYILESTCDFISLLPLELFILVLYGTSIPRVGRSGRSSLDWEFDRIKKTYILTNTAYMKLKMYYKTLTFLKANRLIRLYRIVVFYSKFSH